MKICLSKCAWMKRDTFNKGGRSPTTDTGVACAEAGAARAVADVRLKVKRRRVRSQVRRHATVDTAWLHKRAAD